MIQSCIYNSNKEEGRGREGEKTNYAVHPHITVYNTGQKWSGGKKTSGTSENSNEGGRVE